MSQPQLPSVLPPASSAGERGVLSLEFALLLPVVAMVLMAIVLAAVHGVDQLAVQEAARQAARVAATTRAGEAPTAAASESAFPRIVSVVVKPASRRPGDRVLVAVRHTRDVGWLHWTVTGVAHAVAEPRTGW